MIGQVPTPAQLHAFAAGARRDRRRLVVGALVHDAEGRVFVQRRSLRRALYPGCWDVVGGHAEAGEGVREALTREVREETGWELQAVEEVVEVLDWEAGGEAKREIDVLVTVRGDLEAPRLEQGKHTGARWLRADELPLLLERRDPDDVFIHDIVQRAFAVLGVGGSVPDVAPPDR
ncbi:MAG TPA: NUDIX domain-containing protein [Trueperaceae bacterium]|nr:NUDIX domain-containing protein [Trueperaceae bacterium]